MSSLVVQIDDSKKVKLIKDLLSQYDFVKIIEPEIMSSKEEDKDEISLLDLKGIWSDYKIDSELLRKNAWTRF